MSDRQEIEAETLRRADELRALSPQFVEIPDNDTIDARVAAVNMTPEHIDPPTDSQKIEVIRQQVDWLCQQVMTLMSVMMSNPMVKMAMANAQRKASK